MLKFIIQPLGFIYLIIVLQLNYRSLRAVSCVGLDLSKHNQFFAKFALGERIFTVHGFMLQLFLFKYSGAAALADYPNEVAVVELVRPQQQLHVGQLVLALLVDAAKPDLVQVLLLQLVDVLEVLHLALAGRRVVLGRLRGLPPFYARSAKIGLTDGTLSALYLNIVAKVALEVTQ